MDPSGGRGEVNAGVADKERRERSRALSLHPRPLSARQAAILWEAVAPLLRDMEATGQARPDIRAEAHAYRGVGIVCAWIRDPGGTGRSISVLPPGQRGDQLADLAEQLQDWTRGAQADPRRPQWPDCPAHPGDHRLEPYALGETAEWECPQTIRVIAEIGALDSPPQGIPRIKSRKHS
jgi:hypothetical protein